MNAKEVSKRLKNIESYFKELESIYGEHNPWNLVWLRQGEYLIKSLEERLGLLKNGQLLAATPKPEIEDFWKLIFSQAKKTIRTTNIHSDGLSSFGRLPNKELLDLQADAMNRGVEVTRMFVFDKKNNASSHEILSLKNVMNIQIELKINVLSCHIEQFEYDKIQYDFEYRDFMIIDDQVLYTSEIDSDFGSQRSILHIDDKLLDSARKLWISLESYADVLTIDNINSFPSI